MKNESYTLDVRLVDGRFEVYIPELGEGVKAYGSTHDEALENAERAIVEAQMARQGQLKQKTA